MVSEPTADNINWNLRERKCTSYNSPWKDPQFVACLVGRYSLLGYEKMCYFSEHHEYVPLQDCTCLSPTGIRDFLPWISARLPEEH